MVRKDWFHLILLKRYRCQKTVLPDLKCTLHEVEMNRTRGQCKMIEVIANTHLSNIKSNNSNDYLPLSPRKDLAYHLLLEEEEGYVINQSYCLYSLLPGCILIVLWGLMSSPCQNVLTKPALKIDSLKWGLFILKKKMKLQCAIENALCHLWCKLNP